MKTTMLDEFIAFAKKEFGVTVSAHESDKPDSFETIFGDCFSDNSQKISQETCEYNSASVRIVATGMEMSYECNTQLDDAA